LRKTPYQLAVFGLTFELDMPESQSRALKTRIWVRNPTRLWYAMSARWIRG